MPTGPEIVPSAEEIADEVKREAERKRLRDLEVAQETSTPEELLARIEPEGREFYEITKRLSNALLLSIAISTKRQADVVPVQQHQGSMQKCLRGSVERSLLQIRHQSSILRSSLNEQVQRISLSVRRPSPRSASSDGCKWECCERDGTCCGCCRLHPINTCLHLVLSHSSSTQ